MTSTSEWLPEPTIRRRLWELAKFKRTDVKLGLSVRQLIDNLVTAHIKNWYGDKIQVDSEGNRLVEGTPVLRRICRLKPDIWLAGNSVEAPAEEARRRRGPQPGTVDRYGDADHALFPEMERLIALPQYGSAYAAALHLASEGKVEGAGTEASRARRLLAAYKKKLAETR